MFRLPEDQGLINRLGFNNHGSKAFATTLASAMPKIPVGVNLGKSKIVDLDGAAADYQASYRLLHHLGDYFVINVSSPNTPGLRQLQDRARLEEIVDAIQEVDSTRPLFIKIAPDLEWAAIDEIVQLAEEKQLTGLIATNTTVNRDGLVSRIQEEGGVSGKPLKQRSNEVLSHLYHACPKEMILIGVGGIFDGDDLYEKICLGAHLCQIYTGWIYGGPQMVPLALERLDALMNRDGVTSLSELRGTR
jgi:dihydroorotate dehydrogenase